MSTLPLRRLLIGLRGRYHLWSGRRAYRAGRIRMAGRHLDEALSCGRESFVVYLLLGKIAYRERDMGRAAAFFHRARSADPARFALEGFPDDFIAALREQPETTAPPQYRIVIEARRMRAAKRARTPQHSPTPGDFSSHEEWLRHKRLPTLQPGEGADIDWDAEARKLFGE